MIRVVTLGQFSEIADHFQNEFLALDAKLLDPIALRMDPSVVWQTQQLSD